MTLEQLIDQARRNADAKRDEAAAKAKAANESLPTGQKIPVLVVRNHAKAVAFHTEAQPLVAALASNQLHVKGIGKVLKNGDVNVRIGAPVADLGVLVADYRAKMENARAKRKAAREAKKGKGGAKGGASNVVAIETGVKHPSALETILKAANASDTAGLIAKLSAALDARA